MRKLNLFLVTGIFITFLFHALGGAFRLFGADSDTMKIAAYICLGLIAAHIVVTFILTLETLKARQHSGSGYFKNNLIFWARRISGFTILIPLLMHILIFHGTGQDSFRLVEFHAGRLISQILLVISLAFHVLTNIKPLLISFGIRETKAFTADIIFVLSVILLIAACAFSVYYLRWMAY